MSSINRTEYDQQNLRVPQETQQYKQEEDIDDDEVEESPKEKRSGRRKIKIEYIDDQSRRHITFSKRKADIMKKAYELSTLTGTQVLLLVVSETGQICTFATTKLQPLITTTEGKALIQSCLNAPDVATDNLNYPQGAAATAASNTGGASAQPSPIYNPSPTSGAASTIPSPQSNIVKNNAVQDSSPQTMPSQKITLQSQIYNEGSPQVAAQKPTPAQNVNPEQQAPEIFNDERKIFQQPSYNGTTTTPTMPYNNLSPLQNPNFSPQSYQQTPQQQPTTPQNQLPQTKSLMMSSLRQQPTPPQYPNSSSQSHPPATQRTQRIVHSYQRSPSNQTAPPTPQIIDTAKWIKENYTPYEGDASFLVSEASQKTKDVWAKCSELRAQEIKSGGCLDVDNKTISTVNAHEAGYIIKENEDIVGLQTDAPLKRSIKPFGGVRIVKNALKAYNHTLDPEVEEIFKYRKTHNDCVFDIYTPEMRKARSNAILTGLPDGYGRGRIIGDYRRIALYGVDQLIEWKMQDKLSLGITMTEENMRTREELAEQIKALNELKALGQRYGYDLSKPATNAKEAIQWTYFGYLASVKDQDGAAMSFGRVDCFFDIYIENDMKKGLLNEAQAQDLINQLIIKLRLVRHLRTPEYNDLFAGDPTWVTMVVGGMNNDGRPLVTKTSYRIVNTLRTLGAAPEPNITVLWNNKLPTPFKHFCNKISIDTSSIQYENDNLMNKMFGDDYAIACCVSQMRVGKDMQFFGARCNLAKLLLYAFNHGYDERTEKQVGPDFGDIKLNEDGSVNFESAWEVYDKAMDWIACLYVNTMNAIHYSHDKYCYEAIQMALHDTNVHRYMAFGIAGFSVIVDSFSAIKYAKVFPVRNPETNLTTDFKIEGEFPKFGNDDDRVDHFAVEIPKIFLAKLKKYPAYRGAEHTLSILTITSNVVYGKKTGSTPDGRKAVEAFAPGCNPMHGRETNGAVASLNSVSKVEYEYCKDGISNTFTFVPTVLGKLDDERVANLSGLLDGYFNQGGFHLNVNVLVRETLKDAMVHPELYPNLTIRVSGYAVHFIRLTPDQQREVIARTFHETL